VIGHAFAMPRVIALPTNRANHDRISSEPQPTFVKRPLASSLLGRCTPLRRPFVSPATPGNKLAGVRDLQPLRTGCMMLAMALSVEEFESKKSHGIINSIPVLIHTGRPDTES